MARGDPRIPYERTYVLLPPGFDDPAWPYAVNLATWSQHRYTVGGSADDAGLGNLDNRHIIAVNPSRWPTDLVAFYNEYYPGVTLDAVIAETPEDLFLKLSGELIPAFLGADGAGKYTVGGRGGEIVEVTTLEDSGEGSLRWALDLPQPRVINVMTSGNVLLERNITVKHPYFTLNGNAGGGMGICTRGAVIRVQTHQGIIRFIRSRPGVGDWVADDNTDALDLASNVTDDPDQRIRDIIVDHCTFSWATDENVALWNSTPDHWMERITVQWCIISEGLHNASHPDGSHSMGLLAGSREHRHSIRNVSIHHNLFAHNFKRNPRMAAVSPIEVVNNVSFDTPGYVAMIKHVPTYLNYIGNTAIEAGQNYMLLVEAWRGPDAPVEEYLAHQLYVVDNIGPFDTAWPVGKGWGSGQHADGGYQEAWQSLTPLSIASELVAEPRVEAYAAVLSNAGCLPRCSVDTRIIEDVVTGNTGLIDSQDEVGGWPELS